MQKAIDFINENTSVPFKIILPIVASIVGATVWIQTTLQQIRLAQSDSVRRQEFRIWRNELFERNESINLRVPYLDKASHEKAAGENCPE